MPPVISVFQKIIRKDAGLIRSRISFFHGGRRRIVPFTISWSSIPIHTTIGGGGGGDGGGDDNNNNNYYYFYFYFYFYFNVLAKHPQGHYRGSVRTYNKTYHMSATTR
jgi:hypothetical protein